MSSPRPLRVLIVEDVEDDAVLLAQELERGGFELHWDRVDSPDAMAAAIYEPGSWDIVISDYAMPGFGALAALGMLQQRDLDVPFIIVSGVIGEESAVDALRAGAHDYVTKGSWARLVPAVERELAEAASRAERRRAAQALRESESRLRSVMAQVADAIVVLDGSGRVDGINPAGERILGGSIEELRGTALAARLAEPDRGEYERLFDGTAARGRLDLIGRTREVVVERSDGARFPIELTVTEMELGGEQALLAVARDITERKKADQQLQYLADHDGLTGLFNRRRFEEELVRQVAAAERYGGGGTTLLLDIDNFKQVNDSHGHPYGDELLRTLGELLSARFRKTDFVARLGGDEFAILLPHTSTAEARHVAQELMAIIREQPMVISGQRIRLTTSIGIASFDPGRSSADVMLAVDAALYDAKESGRDRVALYTPRPAEDAARATRRSWSERIRSALADDDLMAYRQPILDLRSGLVSHHELLVRMRGDDDQEPILPSAFLPTAERVGLIGEIDRFMIRQAIGLIADSGRAGAAERLEVNISAKSLSDTDLLGIIEAELTKAAIDPSLLIFEITETAAIANMEDAQRFARHLRHLGCRFALDDFGAGFASFYYVKHLPLDYLKIDGDFVRHLPHNPTDQLVVQHMAAIGSGLGLKTIAEFVEDRETLSILRKYGVDFAQGFYIGRPEPTRQAARR